MTTKSISRRALPSLIKAAALRQRASPFESSRILESSFGANETTSKVRRYQVAGAADGVGFVVAPSALARRLRKGIIRRVLRVRSQRERQNEAQRQEVFHGRDGALVSVHWKPVAGRRTKPARNPFAHSVRLHRGSLNVPRNRGRLGIKGTPHSSNWILEDGLFSGSSRPFPWP